MSAGTEPPRLPDAEWMHALRNALNAAGVANAVARSALDAGDEARSGQFLDETTSALRRAAILLQAVTPGVPAAPRDDTGA